MRRIAVFIIAVLAAVWVDAQSTSLVRALPESQGISSRYLKQFFDSVMGAKNTWIHSCIVMRHGKVIGEIYPKPWTKSYHHAMYSASKTFTSIAVGMCVDEGLISLDDPIDKYLALMIEDKYAADLHNVTIRHLLTMESGMAVDTKMRQAEQYWMRFYLNRPLVATPGTRFAYDSISTYLLSAIVQEVTGEKLYDFLWHRLFLPMGMPNARWEESPEGVTCGGWGLYIRPEGMAKFGQFLLDRGKWNGVQLVSRKWVNEMMKPQSTTSKYGYQMWMCDYDGWGQANGAYGQLIYIIPKQDMVVTFTQCCSKNAPLQRWIHDLLTDNCKRRQIKPVRSDQEKLVKAEAEYVLPTVKGKSSSVKYGRNPLHLSFANNELGWERATLKFDANMVTLSVVDKEKCRYSIRVAYNKWHENTFEGHPYCQRTFLGQFSNINQKWHVAGSYAWIDESTLKMRLHWIDWISSADVTFRFSGATAKMIFISAERTKAVTTNAWVK